MSHYSFILIQYALLLKNIKYNTITDTLTVENLRFEILSSKFFWRVCFRMGCVYAGMLRNRLCVHLEIDYAHT